MTARLSLVASRVNDIGICEGFSPSVAYMSLTMDHFSFVLCRIHQLPLFELRFVLDLHRAKFDMNIFGTGGGKPPGLLALRSSKWFILAVATVAIFSEMFLSTAIVAVVPFALDPRVGVAPEGSQYWTSVLLTTYGAALFFGSLPAGKLADRRSSRKIPFMLGLAALASGSLLLCLGTNVASWIIGRILQGLAGAVVWTIGFALLADTFEQDQLGTAVGIAMLGWTSAILIGPVLGGLVYAAAGYYAVFYMVFGILALDILLRSVMIERNVAARWSGSKESETSRPPFAEQPAPIAATQKTRWPVLALLQTPRVLMSLWGAFVQAITTMAFDSTLALHVSRVFGFNSNGAGLVFLALVVPSLLSPFVGKVMDCTGRGCLIAAVSWAVACPALVLLRLVDVNVSVAGNAPGSTNQLVLLCALLAVVGLTLAVAMVPVLAELTVAVDEREKAQPGIFGPRGAYGRAYSLMNMTWSAGAIVGPVIAGSIVNNVGWATLAWVLGLLNGVTAVPMLLMAWQEQRLKRLAGDKALHEASA